MNSYPISAIKAILLLCVLAIAGAGCQTGISATPDVDAREEAFLSYLRNSKHAVLACVTRIQLERKTLPEKHKLYQEATVVRSFKGGFVVGERISYYSLLEEIPAKLPTTLGDLEFLFPEARSPQPILLGLGQGWKHDARLEWLLDHQ